MYQHMYICATICKYIHGTCVPNQGGGFDLLHPLGRASLGNPHST